MDPTALALSPLEPLISQPPRGGSTTERPVHAEAERAGSRADGDTDTVNVEFKNHNVLQACPLRCKQREISQTTDEAATIISDNMASPRKEPFCSENDTTHLAKDNDLLNSGFVCSLQVPHDKENRGQYQQATAIDKCEQFKRPSRLGLNLNEVDSSTSEEHNPFYPYKKLGQTKVSDASECGSTTGFSGETDSQNGWKEMQQNGFLSLHHGSLAMPIPDSCRPKRKWDDELSRFPAQKPTRFLRPPNPQKPAITQANTSVKTAAPSGLLSGLNPGIISKVRNSKQVYSIIRNIVQTDKLDHQGDELLARLKGNCSRESTNGKHGQIGRSGYLSVDNACSQYRQSVNNVFMCEPNVYKGSHSTLKYAPDNNDSLKLQLSLGESLSERTAISYEGDLTSNQEYMNSLSLRAATVASQWLDLLQQDIRGRLAALKRSKRRVRNAIQTELPYLATTAFSSNQGAELKCSEKSVPDAHVARWSSLFSEMDKALNEEGSRLESLLRNVQEMQVNCENGLSSSVGGLHIGSTGEFSLEALERDCAIKAAAASIYSTCNLVMRAEIPPPCF